MKKFLLLIVGVAMIATGCGQPPAANTGTPAASPAASSSPKAAAAKKDEKKPPSTTPVPADWVRMYDDAKGYEFYVPQGTQNQNQTVDGVDVYLAAVPAPYDIGVMVVAFKDKTLTKDDLLKRAENILKGFEEKDIKIDPPKQLSEDYSLVTFTSTDKAGKPGKGKILVGTDVTDNYIMIVGGELDKYAASEKTIDEIWGSFSMYSGGASGNN
jgi:hypothetical protein